MSYNIKNLTDNLPQNFRLRNAQGLREGDFVNVAFFKLSSAGGVDYICTANGLVSDVDLFDRFLNYEVEFLPNNEDKLTSFGIELYYRSNMKRSHPCNYKSHFWCTSDKTQEFERCVASCDGFVALIVEQA